MTTDLAYNDLASTIANGAIALVGAGVSVSAGYPAWNQLLDQMGQWVMDACPDRAAEVRELATMHDGMVRAAEYERLMGRAVARRQLVSLYGPNDRSPIDDMHRNLVRLPFRHLLTTNYDRILETAEADVHGHSPSTFDFHNEPSRRDFFDNSQTPGFARRVIHVHGSVGDGDGIILTLDDYNERYERQTWAKSALQTLFSTHRCVFLGFSLSDEDFMASLRFLSAVLGSGDPKHFAILPPMSPKDPCCESPEAYRRRLRLRYRVEPVFYAPPELYAERFKHLVPFLEKLRADVVAAQPSASAPPQVLQEEHVAVAIATDVTVKQLLQKDPVDVEALRKALSMAIRRTAPALPASAATPPTPGEERTALDNEIEDAFEFVKRGQPDVTVQLLTRMLERNGSRLGDRLRYRMHANRGHAFYTIGDNAKAADDYLVASRLRNTPEARGLAALAHVLLGDRAKAGALALQLTRDEPALPRGWSLRLQALPDDIQLEAAEALVPEDMKDDPEVATALGGIAWRDGLYSAAERYAAAAVKGSPNWANALMQLGAAIVMVEKEAADVDVGLGLVPAHPERLREAERILTRAIELIPSPGPADMRAIAHLNRASARRLLGSFAGADADTREAFARKPQDPDVAATYALMCEGGGNPDEAIRALRDVPALSNNWRSSILLAELLNRRGQDDDRERALELLLPWRGRPLPADQASDLMELITSVCLAAGEPMRAKDAIASTPADTLIPGIRDLLLGKIAFRSGQAEVARAHLLAALIPVKEHGDVFAKREAAILAERLGEHSHAASLWKLIVRPTRFDENTHHLLRSAHLGGEDLFVLAFCRALRENDVRDRRAYELEVVTLVRCREPEQAKALIAEWLAAHADDIFMRLHLSSLAAARGEYDLVESDPARLPTIAQIKDPRVGIAVVEVLGCGDRPEEAPKYAYELWRKFPDRIETQHALITAVIDRTRLPSGLSTPVFASVDCAVHYRDGLDDRVITAIIETGPVPSAQRGEYAPGHPLALALIGHRPSETASFQGRTLTVAGVENKIVYRARTCLEQFDRVFPDNPLIRRFTIAPEKADKGLREALGSVLDYLERQDNQRRALEGLYVESGLPIPALARNLGKSVIQAMTYLANKQGVGIRCCSAAPEDWVQAAQRLAPRPTLVLDATAAGTLLLLNLHERLADLPFKLVVPDSVLDELRREADRHRKGVEPNGYLGFEGGQPVIHEVAAEQEAAWAGSLDALVASLQRYCEIVGGAATLDFNEPQRTTLLRMLGASVTDAIAVARQRGAVLWTDDLSVAALAKNEWGVGRVWTQVVLAASLAQLGARVHNAAVAALFRLGYGFTAVSAAALVELFKQASWNLDVQPARSAVAFVHAYGAMSPNNCQVTVMVILAIWRHCPKEPMAVKVIHRLLGGLDRATAGPYIAKKIYRLSLARVPDGRAKAKYRRLQRMLRRWRRGMGR